MGVVYFRSGYVPTQMQHEDDWAARLLIERSRAIKCPWIGLHLAGSKKVQQVPPAPALRLCSGPKRGRDAWKTLARPGVVEKYLADRPAEAVAKVRATFAGLWGLEAGATETEEIVRKAILHPNQFVIKPQLGFFFIPPLAEPSFTALIVQKAVGTTSTERRSKSASPGGRRRNARPTSSWSASTRSSPKLPSPSTEATARLVSPSQNYLMMGTGSGGVELADTISELGVYGYLLGNVAEDRVIANAAAGHALRTKKMGTDEGGIMAGAAALDSPFLF